MSTMRMKCAILGLAVCLALLSFDEVSSQVERSIGKLDRSANHRNYQVNVQEKEEKEEKEEEGQSIKRKTESESSWEKNTTSTDKKKLSVSLLEESLNDSFEVNNTIQYEATSAHGEVGESSSMMDEVNREIEAHLSGLNKQAGSVAFGESSDTADFDVERRTQLEEIERQIKAAAATRIVAEEGRRKSKEGTHEINSEAGNELETTRNAHKTESEYKAGSTESGQKCSTCGGVKKGNGGSWMFGSLGSAQSGVWRCFDQDKNGIKVEEDASIVIPKYDIDTIIKEESASQDSASKTLSLIASLTQIVEKHRKELRSSSVNLGKSTQETSETVEKLKATLKQYRGISARELVTRSDFEEILETAALYEELSSASVSYISKLSMYRSLTREGIKSSQRVQLAQARAKLLKDMADEKQRIVDDQFALVKDLAQRGDTLYVKIFAIKKLVAKLEAEKEEVDLSFEETVRNLSSVIGEASEAYEEYHVVVRKWKEEQAAADFSREAIENAEVVWVQFLSTL